MVVRGGSGSLPDIMLDIDIGSFGLEGGGLLNSRLALGDTGDCDIWSIGAAC